MQIKKHPVLKLTLTLLITCGLILSSGCSKKPTDENAVPGAYNADENPMGDSDSSQAMGLQTVTFPFDSFELVAAAKATLDSNMEILKSNSSLNIQIEGHCDERGGTQYNLALGEKRANAVRNYLTDKGVSPSRMTTISFGEERPIDSTSSESAWAKNRRANFVITSR